MHIRNAYSRQAGEICGRVCEHALPPIIETSRSSLTHACQMRVSGLRTPVVLLLKVKILVINDFAFEHLFAINYGLRQ